MVIMDHGVADLAFETCTGEFGTLLGIANFTLWVGVVAAIVISILTVAERIAVLVKKPVVREGAGGSAGVASFLDALKGLIAALAAAPPWFAIFLAGVLLLWCAGKFTPAECRQSLTHTAHSTAETETEKAAPAK
jgi:hypothetical protein